MSGEKIVRVGSRDSALAVEQTRLVIETITHSHPEVRVELVTMKTVGDLNFRPFEELNKDAGNPKRLFIKELEQALLDGRIDLAVHSLKDMPAERPDDPLPILAFFKRGDPRDALVLARSAKNKSLESFGFTIGSSSARRRVQLAGLMPGCAVRSVRGNVLTRLKKLDEGRDYSALVLAAAGLKRLGQEHRISRIFEPEEMIPAAGQGVLVCQGLRGKGYGYLDAVNDPDSQDCAGAERAFVARLESGCTLPTAAYAELRGMELRLMALYADEKRGIYRKGTLSGNRKEAVKLGESLAENLIAD
ncbi:MAG: hydroxymethylbilane synthase [Synergistaceae bacterium]|nr:hydroxymethylbilane synthase [Synergistaceae bacterium]